MIYFFIFRNRFAAQGILLFAAKGATLAFYLNPSIFKPECF